MDDKVLQRLHHAVTFDLLLSLMAVELIFSPKILPDLIFKMCVADGDFVMASDQKLAHIGNHSKGQFQTVCGHIQYLAACEPSACLAGEIMTAQTVV